MESVFQQFPGTSLILGKLWTVSQDYRCWCRMTARQPQPCVYTVILRCALFMLQLNSLPMPYKILHHTTKKEVRDMIISSYIL